MKLDRNINPDGKGKYALINLRKNTVEWGGDDNQFFVIKYSDKFAAPALRAYAKAVFDASLDLRQRAEFQAEATKAAWLKEADELLEFSQEMSGEIALAEKHPNKKRPD